MTRRAARLGALLLLALVWVCSGARPARAEDGEPPARRLGMSIAGRSLLATFGYRDVFSRSIADKLTSGLPTRVVVQINLEREGSGVPVAYWVRTADIVYDLWEEVYVVTVEDEEGRRRARVATAEAAMDLAGALRRANVANLGALPAGIYRLRVLVEVNPVSREMVENIRRWLTRPPAGRSGTAGQTNFFGSFVGIFVDRRIGQADRIVSFVSQWLRLDAP